MSSLNVKSGDLVEITVGGEANKGKRGRIISVDVDNHKVMVEGLNLVKKHRKPRKAQEQGGIIDKPRAIDVSNVMVVCPKCKEATRVSHVIGEKGKFVRSCKKCGAIIDAKAAKAAAKEEKAKKATAKKAAKAAKKTEE